MQVNAAKLFCTIQYNWSKKKRHHRMHFLSVNTYYTFINGNGNLKICDMENLLKKMKKKTQTYCNYFL